VNRFSGTEMTVAILLEAEMVVLAGGALGSTWIARLGAVLLAIPLMRLLVIDVGAPRWTPVTTLAAVMLAANRAFLLPAWYFSAGAAALAAAVVLEEIPRLWSAPLIAAGALVLLLSRRPDLVWISVPAFVFAFGRAAIVNAEAGAMLTTSLVVVALYGGQRLWFGPPAARTGLSLLGTALLTLFVYEKAQGRLLTMCLGLEGGFLLVAGFFLQDRTARLSGLALFLLCIAKLFLYDLRQLDAVSRILSFIVLGLMLMGGSWLYTRFRDKFSRLL
jgi:uncharacterized membrane protein